MRGPSPTKGIDNVCANNPNWARENCPPVVNRLNHLVQFLHDIRLCGLASSNYIEMQHEVRKLLGHFADATGLGRVRRLVIGSLVDYALGFANGAVGVCLASIA